jgi:MoaA/NifB/PqqE/SkfB family radical SAM enzyme
MPDVLIDRLIDEMSRFERPFMFSPFKVSEPLLDKRLFPILEKVNKQVPLARIRIFTNGAALTWDNAEKLSWIDNLELFISVNSHIKEEYEPLMGLNFERMLKHVDQLHGSDFPHPVSVLKVGADPEFREFCEDRWPHFNCLLIKKDGWLGYTEADRSEVPDGPCARWFELSICSDGRVSHCCMDSGETSDYVIGDVNHQTLLEVYNSPFWKERREKLLSRRGLDDRSPCNRCTY